MLHFPRDLAQLLIAWPGYWPLAFWVPLFVALWTFARLGDCARWPNGARWVWPAVGIVTLAAFACFWLVQLRSPVYLGPIQPQVAEVAWYFVSGKPIYHAAMAGEVYNMLYGPDLYIITGWFEKWFGPGDFSYKLPGALAVASALSLFIVHLWKRAGIGMAIFGASVFCGIILAMNPEELFSRADVFIVLALVIGYVAANSPSKLAPVILGAALGLAVNLKIHAAAYFIPLLGMTWQTGKRWKTWLVCVATAGFVALAPFILFANVSLGNYLWTLRVASAQGINPLNYLNLLEVFFNLCAPLLALAFLALRQDAGATRAALAGQRNFILLLLVAFVALLLPSSKYGAGPHHLLPLTVLMIFLAAELHTAGIRPRWDGSLTASAAAAVLLSWLVSCLGIGLTRSYQNAAYLQERTAWAKSVEAELGQIATQYGPGHVLLMGASDNANYEYSYFRPQLVFGGQPIGFDPCGLMEREFPGAPVPDLAQLKAALAQAYPNKDIVWIVPKAGEPFSITSYFARWGKNGYLPNPPAYSDKFRADFSADCTKIATTQYYDLYTERTPPRI